MSVRSPWFIMLFNFFVALLIFWIIVLLLQCVMCVFLWLFLRFSLYIGFLQFDYDVLPWYAFLCCFLPAWGLLSILELSKYQDILEYFWPLFLQTSLYFSLSLSGASITYMLNNLILSYRSLICSFFFLSEKRFIYMLFIF